MIIFWLVVLKIQNSFLNLSGSGLVLSDFQTSNVCHYRVTDEKNKSYNCREVRDIEMRKSTKKSFVQLFVKHRT